MAWRFGTWEVKEGKLDAEKIGNEVLGGFYFHDLLYKKWNISKLLIAVRDGIHLGVVNPNHLAVSNEDKLALGRSEQVIAMSFECVEFGIEYGGHQSTHL